MKEIAVEAMGRLTISEVSLRPSGWFTRLVWGLLNFRIHLTVGPST